MPKISLGSLRSLILLILVATFTFGGGFYAGSGASGKTITEVIKVSINREQPIEHKELNFSLFWKVWDSLSANYYDKTKLKEADMIYGAIRGMVASVGDPYTVFLPPEENKVVQEDLSGSFQGVGIQIGFRGTRLAVIAPLPESPAQKAGIKAGDLIIGIKDEKKGIDRSTEGITLPEAVEAIRGESGTKVTLALLREEEDKPIIVEVMRENIDVPSVVLSFEGENKDVGHLKILKFSGETKIEWNDAVGKLLDHGALKGIIVDVRNNPGGYLQGAIDLSSEFLKIGSVVVLEEGKQGMKREFKVEKQGKLLDKKVVVLINKGSASASEIMAGALRDVKNIKLIGETSFGKGTIQEPIQVNGAGLHITTSKWLTPKGTWVHEKGLEPDINIEDKDDTQEDEQLEEAIKQFN